jgi:hypothetical protein
MNVVKNNVVKMLKIRKMTAAEAYWLKLKKNRTREEYARFGYGFVYGVTWMIGELVNPNGVDERVSNVIDAEKLARSAGATASAYFAARVKLGEELLVDAEDFSLRDTLNKKGEGHLLEKLLRKYGDGGSKNIERY